MTIKPADDGVALSAGGKDMGTLAWGLVVVNAGIGFKILWTYLVGDSAGAGGASPAGRAGRTA